jgi:hypothetical protein
MQEIINAVSQFLPLNMDALVLSLATALATGIVMALKALFSLARRTAKKTPTALDDRFVDETEAALKEKGKDV